MKPFTTEVGSSVLALCQEMIEAATANDAPRLEAARAAYKCARLKALYVRHHQ